MKKQKLIEQNPSMVLTDELRKIRNDSVKILERKIEQQNKEG